jgi:hypothetical protein
MDRAKLKAKFAALVKQGEAVLATRKIDEPPDNVIAMPVDYVDAEKCAEWGAGVIATMATAFGKGDEFYSRSLVLTKNTWRTSEAMQLLALVRAAVARIDDGLDSQAEAEKVDAVDQVVLLCERFHTVAREIRGRHAKRPTLAVADEYDVQDLLRGLLRVFFDDVRPEEWTPSYAGGGARMDFLLAREKIVVETKMAREGLEARTLGEELLVDIAKYATHPGCKRLVCFVYDPQGWIRNPAAVEGDLTKTHENLPARVLIRPKH